MSNQQINNSSMLRKGTVLRGIYRIDSYLSSGGFGNTYIAYNTEFEEKVAIKEFFMRGVTQRDENQTTVSVSNSENRNSFIEQREKFKKEARRIRQLRNEHIVGVHDLFEENGTAYYVMDYVDGESLKDRLKRTRQPMSEQEVRQILPQLLDALKVVHAAGLWHLDLKPGNIMIDHQGVVKLIDFGASKQLNAQQGGATASTDVSYTNGFAPREQMEKNYEKMGPWTDIYALGATLYNLLTNQHPPLPSDIDDDITPDKHEALPLPTGVSNDMRQLIVRMMQTNRNKRPQSIDDIMPLTATSQQHQQQPSVNEETILAQPKTATPQTATVTPPPTDIPPTPTPTSSAPSSGPSASNINPYDVPSSNLVWAILSTILCCPPTGIVAIVHAAKVDSLWRDGQREEAYNHSRLALKWSIGSIIAGLVSWILFVAVISCSVSDTQIPDTAFINIDTMEIDTAEIYDSALDSVAIDSDPYYWDADSVAK